MKSLLLILLVLVCRGLLCVPNSFGQSAATGRQITGIVSDSISRKPMDFITVNLMLGKENALKADFTKENGSFTFSNLKPGEYTVVVVGVGYRTKMLPANLRDSTLSVLDLGNIRLSQNTVGLKEVTVTSVKPIVQQEVDRITYDLQADPESKVYSVLDMMRKVPYLAVDADENIQLKGNTDFRILINGKPSSMMERSYKDVLRSMPASSIDRIEVITTPPAKYDAEGLAGIINIITHRKIDNGYSGTLNLSERFPVGGPGIGGTFAAKLGKIGMTVLLGGSQHRVPSTLSAVRRNTLGERNTNMFQEGSWRSRNNSGYIGYEISYEIDTLNLLSAQFNINGSYSDGSGYQASRLMENGQLLEAYRIGNDNNGNGNGMDAAVNFQRTSKADKNRLLTFSYRYFGFDNKQKNILAVTEQFNFDLPDYRQVNDQGFSEQTFQVDYVYPVKKLTIEAGLKGITRNNRSDFQYDVFDPETGTYKINPDMSNQFSNIQNVFGAYNTYQYNLKKWSFKGGVRVEQTIVNADFISTESEVRQNYLNVIPSLSVNRKLKNNNALNLGYSQRIQRPGIWQLNPFIDRSNPNFERTGNPDLRPAFVNDIQLGYSINKKVSVNIGAGLTAFRDLIFGVAVYNPETNITQTSFENSGTARLIMGMLNVNYPITKQWNFSLNARVAHGKVKGTVNNLPVTNQGIMSQVSASTGYRLKNDWRINANLNINGRNINLQGINNSMTSYAISVNKDVIKDKLSLSAAANNPFTKFRNWRRETYGPNFDQLDSRRDYFRTFNFSVNYKFGKLKEAIKKNKRGIRNDDVQNGG